MKPSVPITLIITGAILAAAPITYGFILQALEEKGGLDPATRTGCLALGIVLIVAGIVLSFMRSPGRTN